MFGIKLELQEVEGSFQWFFVFPQIFLIDMPQDKDHKYPEPFFPLIFCICINLDLFLVWLTSQKF